MICSVIIRAFNEDKHIGKLINGILAQISQHEIEVILVDSGSTDNTVSIAQSLGAKVVSILPEDFSFGYALNKGCETAKGDILLFASAHVYPVYTHWIDMMLKPFEDAKVACVYGRQIGYEKSKYSEHRLLAKWFPAFSNHNQHHPFCNNANTAVRKSLWEEQPYDETLTGLEDLDWASKILKKGYRIAYEAEAVIVHIHEETPKKVYNRYYREAIAFKRIVPYAKFNFFDFIYLSLTNIVSDYYFALKDGVLLKNLIDIPVFRILQFYGTLKGYNHSGNIDNSLRTRFYYPTNFLRKHNPVEIKAAKIEY
ncbi:glycosyltransferase family 2 protein [Flectobacillus longus]|uniref:glycosyltransferase family 2 protein n=1 Tax=Flectobacillus longus TaxID=2984207 RepID=UPI0024B77702|nr:glycosyltransferase [Flectobacillus longus]MDI9880058.1 glycosyltransferase [Flectobacillus longus]